MRQRFPSAAPRTVSLAQLLARPGTWEEVTTGLDTLEPLEAYDILDPAGGDAETYRTVAQQLWGIAHELVELWGR